MAKRFISIWFRHLSTDWFELRNPSLRNVPFVLSTPSHGRMMVTAANAPAQSLGVQPGIVVADARAIIPSLQVIDDIPDLSEKLLKRIAEWCIRFTPSVAIDLPGGLLLDVSGCPHLWGSDQLYLKEITQRLNDRGYVVQLAMADTIGLAWAIARFGRQSLIIEAGCTIQALLPLPPAALRVEMETIELLNKLGLRKINDFIGIPQSTLRRRFGPILIQRLNQAVGREEEMILPVQPIEPYQERLPCLEPIVTLTGIEIALEKLLDNLCSRLRQEQKGGRQLCLKCYRVDDKMMQVSIGTNRPSHNARHFFKLFEDKLCTIEPALGIELFVLQASKVADHLPAQEKLWDSTCGLEDTGLAELLDRLQGRIGEGHIHRYLPDEHYWPERSVKKVDSLYEKSTNEWKVDRPRPVQLLPRPEQIEVTAPIPDYPPMLFRYKGNIHKIARADGPERIEQEWWLQEGQHRDYYYVEDEEGHRYWLFRAGHYTADRSHQWFLHGFFA